MLVKKKNQDPNVAQNHATHFSHGECPRDPGNTATEKQFFLELKTSRCTPFHTTLQPQNCSVERYLSQELFEKPGGVKNQQMDFQVSDQPGLHKEFKDIQGNSETLLPTRNISTHTKVNPLLPKSKPKY